ASVVWAGSWLEHVGRVTSGSRPIVANSADYGPALVADEVFLKRECACVRLHNRANGFIRHGQNTRCDTQLPGQMSGDIGQSCAGSEALGPVHMGREIAIAEVEPCRSAQG